ncbi:MAG: alpha-N-arabinofuranosidase [bacterium]
MAQASLTVDPDFSIGRIDPRLFGSFVEHLGRCVYEGIYEPGHPAADEHGLRRDVLDLARELGITVVRYPGGNFVSGYRWEDGVGPDRPTRLDLAWRSVETNAFGLHEFMGWIEQVGAQPMLAVNLGTRGVQEAADLIEYCNFPGGTELSDTRIKNGAADPFGVRLWCLGNEVDGPWQVGQKSASEYGRLAAETAKAMRLVDPSIELVACGSSSRKSNTFASWDAAVLEETYDVVDYLSLHCYFEERSDLASFLASAVDMDAFIGEVIATCDFVKGRRRSAKTMKLSLDEWNVWYEERYRAERREAWQRAPHLIEDEYSLVDAVAVGSYLITLLHHADRISVACHAQLVNVIAPIRTEAGGPAWRQPIFYPFADVARFAKGQSLQVSVRSPLMDTVAYGPVPAVNAAASHDHETGQVAVFLVNRDLQATIPVELTLAQARNLRVSHHTVLHDDDIRAQNSARDPQRVTPGPGRGAVLEDGRLRLELPPVSWTTVVLTENRR